MAFVQSQIPDEQQNQFASQGQTSPNPAALMPPQATQTGGSSGQGGAGGGAPNTPGVGSPTQFGSNASKLSDYLKANQDQVQTMANNIAGNMNTQYSNLQGAADQAGQNFSNEVASGYAPNDTSLTGQIQADPIKVASNPSLVNEFQSMMNDQYTGPTNFESSAPYASVQNDVQNAVQQYQLLNSPAGLSTYLQNNVESNSTPGQNTLDTILLQGNQPAYQTVTSAAQPFKNLTGYLANTAANADASVPEAQQQAAQAQQNASQTLAGLKNTIDSQIQDRLSRDLQPLFQDPSKPAPDFSPIQAALANNSALTPDQINTLGFDPNSFMYYMNALQQLSGGNQLYQGLNGPAPSGTTIQQLPQTVYQWRGPRPPGEMIPNIGV